MAEECRLMGSTKTTWLVLPHSWKVIVFIPKVFVVCACSPCAWILVIQPKTCTLVLQTTIPVSFLSVCRFSIDLFYPLTSRPCDRATCGTFLCRALWHTASVFTQDMGTGQVVCLISGWCLSLIHLHLQAAGCDACPGIIVKFLSEPGLTCLD